MSLNFVGSITVMDRGDAPAQAVLDRNARSLAKRVSDETKNELGQVMKRVDQVSTSAAAVFYSYLRKLYYISDLYEL